MVLRNSLDLSNIPELCLLAIEQGAIKFDCPDVVIGTLKGQYIELDISFEAYKFINSSLF